MTAVLSSLTRRDLLRHSLVAGGVVVSPTLVRSTRAQEATPTGPPGATPTASPATVADSPRFQELGDRVVARMAELQVPGVAVGVVADDVDYAAGYGVRNVDHPMPVDVDTLFQIGSTTKTYTGTALMRLVEQGRLDLEASVRTYLPAFRVSDEGVSAEVTIRDLVTHTAGWFGDVFTETGDGDDALARFVEAMAFLPQIAPLGAYLSYNNASLSVLGRVIEVVTGQTYEAAVGELVFAPLGLERNSFFADQIMTEEFAVGHTASPDDPTGPPVVVTEWALPRAVNPAGGVISSVTDQLRYARFHLGDGTVDGAQVLEAETLHAMQRPLGPGGTLGADVLDGVGVDWLLTTRGGERIVMHGGSTNGQQSSFLMAPNHGFAVTILTNSESGAILAEEAAGWALELFLGVEEPSPAPIDVAPERRAEYAGEFSATPDAVISVAAGDGGLSLSVTQGGAATPALEGPLTIVGEDLAAFDVGGLLSLSDFVRDDAGAVAWLRFSGRLYPRVG